MNKLSATQLKEIAQRRRQLEQDLARARGEVEVIQARMRALQQECSHPHLYTYSAMGELGKRCDLCGYSD